MWNGGNKIENDTVITWLGLIAYVHKGSPFCILRRKYEIDEMGSSYVHEKSLIYIDTMETRVKPSHKTSHKMTIIRS